MDHLRKTGGTEVAAPCALRVVQTSQGSRPGKESKGPRWLSQGWMHLLQQLQHPERGEGLGCREGAHSADDPEELLSPAAVPVVPGARPGRCPLVARAGSQRGRVDLSAAAGGREQCRLLSSQRQRTAGPALVRSHGAAGLSARGGGSKLISLATPSSGEGASQAF